MCDWGIAVKEKDTGAQTKGIVVLQEGKRMGVVGMVMDGKGGGRKNLG